MHLHLLHTSSFSAVFLSYDDKKYVIFFSLGSQAAMLFVSKYNYYYVCVYVYKINKLI